MSPGVAAPGAFRWAAAAAAVPACLCWSSLHPQQTAEQGFLSPLPLLAPVLHQLLLLLVQVPVRRLTEPWAEPTGCAACYEVKTLARHQWLQHQQLPGPPPQGQQLQR
jgi:hypothetical protein